MDQHSIEMMEIRQQLRRQGKLLRWSLAGWLVLASALIMGAAHRYSDSFDSIRVKRLALVDANGAERLVFATGHDQVRIGGKVYKRRSPANGIIFQNAEENELGGFVMLDDGTMAVSLDGLTDQVELGVVERAGLVVFPDGRAGLRINDLKGENKIVGEVGADGEATLKY